MNRLEKLQSDLEVLTAERVQISQNWYLQGCWVTQSKPGGTARTNHKYWQARSRQPIFDGKLVKYLKADEVEDYKAVIARGRQLKQIDRQIEKLQQQLATLISIPGSLSDSSVSSSGAHEDLLPLPMRQTHVRSQQLEETSPTLGKSEVKSEVKSDDLAEQERLVTEVLTNSRALRLALQQSIARGKNLGARNIDLRKG